MNRIITFLFLSLLTIFQSYARPAVSAESAILIEYETGTVLYKKNIDVLIEPASLTKLMTMYLIFEDIKSGRYSIDDYVPISYEGSYHALPPFSSNMGLQVNHRVTVGELLLGLAVVSGNDAANALAVYSADGINEFVERMNQKALELNLCQTHFADPSGLSGHNQTSAWDFARFLRIYIRANPEALKEFHSRSHLTFPKEENWINGIPQDFPRRTKANYNLLLNRGLGVDGLKTGYIEESGFNFAFTAKREDFRLIGIVLGIQAQDYMEGTVKRAEEGALLLKYGYSAYDLITPEVPSLPEVTIWKGEILKSLITTNGVPKIVIPKDRSADVTYKISIQKDWIAPLASGTQVGELVYLLEGKEVGRFSLEVPLSIKQGSWLRQTWHSFLLFWKTLFKN